MSWDFAIELFNEFGLEIYNNTIIGSIDLNHQNKDSYAYSVYIHDNIIGPASRQENLENGIVLEFETNDVRIENNTLNNLGVIVNFTPRTYDLIRNVTIKNNRCENIGLSDGSHQGFALRVGRDGDNKYSIENLLVLQNQFIASTTARPYWGIGLLGALKINNILVQKNTFANFSAGYLFANPGAVIDTLISDSNVLTANGNNNNPSFTNGGPQHFIARHNTSSGGTVFSLTNIKMNIIRPLYYELKGYDLIEPILLLAVIACFFLSYKENIYVYPIAWICIAIHIFLGLDKELPGEIIIDLCYLTVCIYGWLQWKKRDRKKHRIIRVTASPQKSQLLQVAFFGTCYLLLGITLQYLRSYFAAGRIPWADAFVLASAFTATWLVATKKVEAWYWYIAATAAAIPIYFTEHYLVLSMYCILLLLLSIIGLKKWKKRRQPRKK